MKAGAPNISIDAAKEGSQQEREGQTMSRKPFSPQSGVTYWNQGGMYECIGAPDQAGRTIMRSLTSGWTFYAHGVGIYDDGSIGWDYSSGGHFVSINGGNR